MRRVALAGRAARAVDRDAKRPAWLLRRSESICATPRLSMGPEGRALEAVLRAAALGMTQGGARGRRHLFGASRAPGWYGWARRLFWALSGHLLGLLRAPFPTIWASGPLPGLCRASSGPFWTPNMAFHPRHPPNTTLPKAEMPDASPTHGPKTTPKSSSLSLMLVRTWAIGVVSVPRARKFGFRVVVGRGAVQLYFNFKRWRYRR